MKQQRREASSRADRNHGGAGGGKQGEEAAEEGKQDNSKGGAQAEAHPGGMTAKKEKRKIDGASQRAGVRLLPRGFFSLAAVSLVGPFCMCECVRIYPCRLRSCLLY